MPPGQRIEPLRDLLVQLERHHAALKALQGRPRTVRRQLQQRRRPCQFLLPEGHLPLEPLAAQPLTLPLRVIHILDRQRRQRIHLPLAERFVQRRQLPRQHAHRPAIRHDVMHAQVQDVFLLLQLHQARTDQYVLCQIERPMQRLFRQGLLRLFSFLLPKSGQIVIRQRKRLLRQYPLHRLSALIAHKHRAQCLMACKDCIQRTLKCLPIHHSAQTHGGRHVIGRPEILELFQEPQPLLSPRQGNILASWHPANSLRPVRG